MLSKLILIGHFGLWCVLLYVDVILLWMLLGPCLHTLVYYYSSSCYQGHCISKDYGVQRCEICNWTRWIRMKHCVRCRTCIHKYDHHCVLLDICIGQFNHKYYLLFLYIHSISSIYILKYFLILLPSEVEVNNSDIQILSWYYYLFALITIIIVINLILVGYLAVLHTYLISTNQTTYQLARKMVIGYLKNSNNSQPFNKGIINNFKQIFKANSSQPQKWEIPVENKQII